MSLKIAVIIPAFNEERSIGKVIRAIPEHLADEVIVVDNGSTDKTAPIAEEAGATVLYEEKKGYGYACLKGIEYLATKKGKPDIVVFMDGDYSDFPEEMHHIIYPLIHQQMDMVIGSRTKGNLQPGALLPQQRFGNWLATSLIFLFYRLRYSDLGPFRAIRFDKLIDLEMQDKTYGWTVEMQVKAAQKKYAVCEVPVSYRKRIGQSKVSGTVKGTIMAGYKILLTIFMLRLTGNNLKKKNAANFAGKY